MSNGDPVALFLRFIFGDVPARGALKLIAIGALLTFLWVSVRDFKAEVSAEARATRREVRTMVLADSLNMESNRDVRAKLLRKINARFLRLYRHNQWEYEDVEP